MTNSFVVEVTFKNAIKLPNGRHKVLSVFAKGIFPKGKQTQGKDVQVF